VMSQDIGDSRTCAGRFGCRSFRAFSGGAFGRSGWLAGRSATLAPDLVGGPHLDWAVRRRAGAAGVRVGRRASSGAAACSAVSRSSTAATRLDPTAQPPATWSKEPARRSSGTSTRANHAIVRSGGLARQRRPEGRRYRNETSVAC
jgi:hypothetical protein